MKKIEELKEKDFDENGFAYLGSEFLSKNCFQAARFFFHSKKANLNRGIEGTTLTNEVFLTISMPKDEFLQICQKIESVRPVKMTETIKFFLKNNPDQTSSILREMPSVLYENETAAKDIFSAIENNKDTIEVAIDAIKSKMKEINSFKQNSKPQEEKTPEESFKMLIKTYEKELND